MSKAKERALEAYPKSIVEQEGIYDISSYDRNSLERKAFIKGYHQAEKDLALTVEDIKVLDNMLSGNTGGIDALMGSDKWYEEVIRRFNELKK